MWRLRVVCVLALLAVWLTPAAAQEKRPVTFEDILGVKSVSSPAISPDGEWVLFALSGWERSDDDEMRSVSHVYRVGATPESVIQLTHGDKGESSPQWSPDGKWVSFVAARGDGEDVKRQIWLMRAAGGEAFAITQSVENVSSYRWSPDATRIAFVTRDGLSDDEEAKKKRKDDPLVYEAVERMSHLWVVDVAERVASRATDGMSFTVKGQPSWSPSGQSIAFTGAPTPWIRDGRDDIYVVDLDTETTERITENPGPDQAPAWSPDGDHIAFISTPNDNEPLPDGTLIRPLVNARLHLYDVATGAVRDVSAGLDRIPSRPTWTKDGDRVLVSVGDGTYREVFAYEVGTGAYRKLTDKSFTTMGSLSADGSRVAFTRESSASPAEIFVATGDFSAPKQMTHLHPELDDVALGQSEVIRWKSTDGLDVEGVLLKPVGFEPGTRYPLMVVAHGGPTGAHHDYFRVRYGDGGQHWAGRGWAVLYPNPRGSTNYGEAFMRGNLGDWGGGDYRDIIAGVDALIERGIANPEQLAFQGWSYGGYMTCWTVSQTTRFKAAMIGAGLTNLVSMYGTNDIPNYLGTFFNGTLSPETEHLYRERSGLTHAEQVTTPTLILHGGNDERVPIGQPMEFFRALKDRGVPVELVFYPREGHGLREYYHRLDRMKRQYEWMTRHTQGIASDSN